MPGREVPPLAEFLAEVPAFRRARGTRHPLRAVLRLACVAMLGGARSERAIAEWAADHGAALRARRGLTHRRGPSQATIHRSFRGIDRTPLARQLGRWGQEVLARLPAAPAALAGIAVDGKTVRGSTKRGAAEAHLLSALSQRLGVGLGQVAVADKTNEIPTAPALPADLALEGRVVTVDALLTQTALARAVRDRGGDDPMVAKDNQPTLAADLAALFADPAAPVAVAETVTAPGGRLERRRLRASTALVGDRDWPGLHQARCIERTAVGKATGERRRETADAARPSPCPRRGRPPPSS